MPGPLNIKAKYLTRVMLLGGQDVYVAEDVVEVDRRVGQGLSAGQEWIQLTAAGAEHPDEDEHGYGGVGALRPEAIVGFMPHRVIPRA